MTTNAAKLREINETTRYTMWSVFTVETPLEEDREAAASDLSALLEDLEKEGVTVRGLYDLAGTRAEADFMVWWHAETAEALQSAFKRLRRTALGRHCQPFWSNLAMHRPAEFNRSHVPQFMMDDDPRGYVCVYPFVRSYDWYLMDPQERRRILSEHGQQARDFPDVRANTVPAFGLGDYEWILAFEADELHRILELMWKMRYTDARLHVREEIPFFTGPRVSAQELVDGLP